MSTANGNISKQIDIFPFAEKCDLERSAFYAKIFRLACSNEFNETK